MTDFAALMGIAYPLFQAPTGSIAGPELCAAISQAGAMGAMALSWASPEAAAAQVREVRAATDRPFLVNYVLKEPPRSLDAALGAGAPVVAFSWGNPAPYVSAVRSAGAKLGIQVSNIAGVRQALELRPDFLICQGVEAGGHVQSTLPLWSLLPPVVEAAQGVPVIASGGIGDGRAAAEALALGAAGAMLGTRFVATQESRAHPAYKQRLVEAGGGEAVLTVCFDGSWPYAAHRVLRNQTLEEWEAAGCPPVGHRPGEGAATGFAQDGKPFLRYDDTAPRQGMTGAVLDMALYAGTSCGQIHDLPPASALVARLWAECQQAKQL